jgi:hypothetical protein
MATEAPPYNAPIAVPAERGAGAKLPALRIGKDWFDWLSNLVITLDTKPARRAAAGVTARTSSIATTAIATGTVGPGVWRISYTQRVRTPGTVSSSLTTTISWTAGGVAQTFVGAVMNGNTTTTYQQQTLVIRVDAATAISYDVAYASAGATAMEFDFDVVAEELALD